MRKFIFGLLLASMAAAGAWAANTAEYLSVDINVKINGKTVGQSAIVEPGKKIRFISKPNDVSQPATRMDYIIDEIGVTENGEATASISSMVFSSEMDGTWALVSDFKYVVKMGHPASIRKTGVRYDSEIGITVSPISREQMLEKFGGRIPPSSSCDSQSASLADPLAKNGNQDCCSAPCKNGAGSTMVCCGSTTCCDREGGKDCCCTP